MAISVNVTETVVNTDVTNTDITVALTEQTTNVELTYPGPQGASAIVNVTTPITNTGTTTEPNIGIDQTLLSLARTQIVGTAVTEAAGKALTAGTADYATLAGTAVNISGTIAPTQVTGTAAILGANTFTDQQTITPSNAVGLFVKGDAASNDIFQAQINGAATNRFIINTAGRTAIGSPATVFNSAFLSVSSVFTTNPAIVVRAVASQTADLQQWQNSGGTVLTNITSAGGIETNGGMRFYTSSARTGFSTLSNTSGNLSFNYAFSLTKTLSVTAGANTDIPMTVKGAASQTANLTEWQDSASTVRASVSSAGAFTISPSSGTALTVNLASSAVGLIVKAASGNGTDIQQWQSAASTVVARIGNDGTLTLSRSAAEGLAPSILVNTSWLGASINVIPNATNTIGAVFRGNASSGVATQTSDLFQYQTGATGNAVMGGRNALAQLWSGSTAPVTVATGGAISGTSSGTTATLTSASAHGLAVGDLVTIASMTPSGYNGTYLVATVPTTTTFTVTTSGSNLGNSTVSGTASVPAQASITARSAGTIALQLRAAASQVANIMRIEDSSGTTLLRVTSAGNLQASNVMSLSSLSIIGEANSGGQLTMTRQTAAAGNPGANIGRLYFRDGTNANTLKLVVRAGAAGAETTILDNIPT